MRIFIAFLFSFTLYAADDLKPYFDSEKSVVLVGKFRGTDLPSKFFIHPEQLNQEMIFLSGLSFKEREKYDSQYIVIEGKLKIYQKQYMLIKKNIRKAKIEEYSEAILKNF